VDEGRSPAFYGSSSVCEKRDKDVTKVARIILKRFANAREWEEYWQERTKGISNIVVNIGNYRCFSQNFGQ